MCYLFIHDLKREKKRMKVFRSLVIHLLVLVCGCHSRRIQKRRVFPQICLSTSDCPGLNQICVRAFPGYGHCVSKRDVPNMPDMKDHDEDNTYVKINYKYNEGFGEKVSNENLDVPPQKRKRDANGIEHDVDDAGPPSHRRRTLNLDIGRKRRKKRSVSNDPSSDDSSKTKRSVKHKDKISSLPKKIRYMDDKEWITKKQSLAKKKINSKMILAKRLLRDHETISKLARMKRFLKDKATVLNSVKTKPSLKDQETKHGVSNMDPSLDTVRTKRSVEDGEWIPDSIEAKRSLEEKERISFQQQLEKMNSRLDKALDSAMTSIQKRILKLNSYLSKDDLDSVLGDTNKEGKEKLRAFEQNPSLTSKEEKEQEQVEKNEGGEEHLSIYQPKEKEKPRISIQKGRGLFHKNLRQQHRLLPSQSEAADRKVYQMVRDGRKPSGNVGVETDGIGVASVTDIFQNGSKREMENSEDLKYVTRNDDSQLQWTGRERENTRINESQIGNKQRNRLTRDMPRRRKKVRTKETKATENVGRIRKMRKSRKDEDESEKRNIWRRTKEDAINRKDEHENETNAKKIISIKKRRLMRKKKNIADEQQVYENKAIKSKENRNSLKKSGGKIKYILKFKVDADDTNGGKANPGESSEKNKSLKERKGDKVKTERLTENRDNSGERKLNDRKQTDTVLRIGRVYKGKKHFYVVIEQVDGNKNKGQKVEFDNKPDEARESEQRENVADAVEKFVLAENDKQKVISGTKQETDKNEIRYTNASFIAKHAAQYDEDNSEMSIGDILTATKQQNANADGRSKIFKRGTIETENEEENENSRTKNKLIVEDFPFSQLETEDNVKKSKDNSKIKASEEVYPSTAEIFDDYNDVSFSKRQRHASSDTATAEERRAIWRVMENDESDRKNSYGEKGGESDNEGTQFERKIIEYEDDFGNSNY